MAAGLMPNIVVPLQLVLDAEMSIITGMDQHGTNAEQNPNGMMGSFVELEPAATCVKTSIRTGTERQ
jgi:hypothetical protein